MKKGISIILAILMALTALPLTAFAADGSDEIIGDLETIEPIKLDNKTPCYGEYEIIVDEDEYATMAADEKDQYESNNSFSVATALNSQPAGKPTNFSINRSATLHRESWLFGLIEREVDEDYYRFDTFGNSSVTISLTNIPTGCDYDIKLYMIDNARYVEAEDISLVASSTRGSNNDETITRTLEPGRYFLWIYSYNEECDDSTYYNLSVQVSYTAQDMQISSLKYDKGAKAALWVSDYDPCGIAPYSASGEVEVGYWSGETLTAASKFENPYTNYFRDGDPVEHAVVYIWDTELRNQLRILVDNCYTSVYNQLQTDKEILMAWEFVDGSAGTGSTAGSIIISFFDDATKTVQILNVVFTVIPIVATIAKNIFAPSEEAITTKEELLDYLRDVRTALEADENTGNEVVRIASTYTSSHYNYPMIYQTSYYFDFTPSPQGEYLYSSDVISSWNSSSIVHGTIYGITEEGDIENAISHGSNYLPDINTSTIKTIYNDSSMPGALHVGEYHWYKFTATTAGTYSFYTENSIDTVGELFSSVVAARSTTGRLAYNDDGDAGYNFTINYDLSAGQVVYLRVRGCGWSSTGNYTLRVTKLS